MTAILAKKDPALHQAPRAIKTADALLATMSCAQIESVIFVAIRGCVAAMNPCGSDSRDCRVDVVGFDRDPRRPLQAQEVSLVTQGVARQRQPLHTRLNSPTPADRRRQRHPR